MCEYKCINCNRHNIVTLNNISKKLNKGTVKCATCKEYDIDKREKQSDFMKQNALYVRNGETLTNKDLVNDITKLSIVEKLNQDQNEFDNEDDDFKESYFRKHLTYSEFERIRNKIVSFQHEKFQNLDNFIYYPCVKIPNQTRYNPYLYDKNRDVLEKIIYIHFTCECCGEEFFNRDLYIQKNKHKILCSECNFTNNVFKIRTHINMNNEKILYQSKFEKKFIEFCNTNNILVKNGPTMQYNFNGLRKYKVDFELPQLHILIECKDNHIWHKQNLKNGKWQAKEAAVKQFIDNSSEYNEFMMIFPKSFIENTNYILHMTNKI